MQKKNNWKLAGGGGDHEERKEIFTVILGFSIFRDIAKIKSLTYYGVEKEGYVEIGGGGDDHEERTEIITFILGFSIIVLILSIGFKRYKTV